MAKFSRNSTAYADDGSVVAANVPRMSGRGLLIEEGTTNLLTANQSSVETNTAGFISNNTGTTLTQDTTVAHSGNASLKVVTDGTKNFQGVALYATVTSGLSYTFSIYLKGSGTVKITLSGALSAGKDVVLSNDWVRYTITATASARGSASMVVHTNAQLLATTFYADCLQLEQKAYATTWQIGSTTRTAESLTIPATALNASEGTIEFDVVTTTNATQTISNYYSRLFFVNPLTNVSLDKFDLYKYLGKIGLEYRYNGATYHSIQPNVIDNFVKTNVKMRYSLSTNKCSLWINGVMLGTGFPFYGLSVSSINLGHYSVTKQANALFSNLRISNKARSDAELSHTGALEVDEFTTYFLPMNGNLGAQGQGVSVSSGNGTTKQLRTGAGYRSMSAKAAAKSYILRTAKFYPAITTNAAGTVKLARAGSGYRTAIAQSSADVKLIEPSIEISTAVIERKVVTTVIERLSRTEVIGVPYIGDTVTLKAEFYTKGGVLADPVNISLKFFDSLKNQIGTTITIGSQHRISAGVYEYDYTVPSGYSNIFYEFAATQESTPQLAPGRISCKRRVDV